MSRFLFVVLPLAGHVNPIGAVGRALAAQGHEVAWVGSQARLRPWLGPDANIYPTGMRMFRGRSDTGAVAVKSLWEGFIVPFARFTLPAVEKAIGDYQPDVVGVDQHALAGAVAAQRHGLPWASLCTSTMELARPFRELPRVEAWVRGQVSAVAAQGGLPADDSLDLRFSPFLVIAFTTPALLRDAYLPGPPVPGRLALVGPALWDRPDVGFPWDWLDPARRHVLVSVGTMAEDVATESTDFYVRVVEALRPLGASTQVILVVEPAAVPGLPAHMVALPRVPQLELMPRMHAVVCHGGMNTMCEALNHGVPQVIAPITRDQPINARHLAEAGAGIRVHFGRARPGELRAAVTAVLDDPGYREQALRVGASFPAAGGAVAAAGRLARLAG